MNIPERGVEEIPPNRSLDRIRDSELGNVGGHGLHGVHSLQAAHVHDDPEDIRLAHEEGKDTERQRPDVASSGAPGPADAVEVVRVGGEDGEGRHDVGVVQRTEEEQDREEGDVEARVDGVRGHRLGLRRVLRLGLVLLDLAAAEAGCEGDEGGAPDVYAAKVEG